MALQLDGKENVTKRIFEDTLTSNGYQMKPFEFEKLWKKLDSKNGELIPMKLFCDKIQSADHGHSKEVNSLLEVFQKHNNVNIRIENRYLSLPISNKLI